MSLELLIGVIHPFAKNIPMVVSACKVIFKRYPEGPKSLMLELPEWCSESTGSLIDPFFDVIKNIYEEKGSKIIYGDLLRISPNKRLLSLKKEDYKLMDYLSYANYVVKELALFLRNPFFLKKRDKKMLEVIEKENPQVAVVGTYHANYIKKMMPHVRYVAHSLPDTNILFRFLNYLLGQENADERINLL